MKWRVVVGGVVGWFASFIYLITILLTDSPLYFPNIGFVFGFAGGLSGYVLGCVWHASRQK